MSDGSLFCFIRKLLVSYETKIFMRTASKGRCHFVTLAGAAKCASHFAAVNWRECAKHTLFFRLIALQDVCQFCMILPKMQRLALKVIKKGQSPSLCYGETYLEAIWKH